MGPETARAGNCACGAGHSRRAQNADQPRAADRARDRAVAICADPHFGEIVKYGMTVGQIAEVYGAAVGEIERILHKA
jgi:hypothetical protein